MCSMSSIRDSANLFVIVPFLGRVEETNPCRKKRSIPYHEIVWQGEQNREQDSRYRQQEGGPQPPETWNQIKICEDNILSYEMLELLQYSIKRFAGISLTKCNSFKRQFFLYHVIYKR